MNLYDHQSIEVTIPPQCPWHEAQVSYGMPNVDWCEPTICSYISEPANTWSNLGFILVGLLILKQWKQPMVQRFGVIVIVMGLFSAIYHATNNYMSQYLDFIGMSLMTSFLLSFSFLRVTRQSFDKVFTYFWFFVSLNMILIMVLDIAKLPVQMLLLVNATPIIAMEIYTSVARKITKKMGYFLISIVVLVIAQISAQLDLKRIYCHPENLIMHGHVLWHLLCAVSMYFAALHIREMTKE